MQNNVIFFNEYFNLNKSEAELEFINIPVNTDIELFIDPYVISKIPGVWYAEANNLIVDFFEKLVQNMHNGNQKEAFRLLSKLGEPNETHFGLSEEQPDGCGIGKEQALLLYNKLQKSKALKTGYLSDLSDCELLIPGIGSDKISDITTNIIRSKLIEFTEDQCKKLEIPVRPVKSGYYWDAGQNKWERRIAMLPHYNDKPILLVPKSISRDRTASNYRHYYNNVILEFLQDWHISMNTNLVKVLKNGKRKVYKKDLKAMHRCTKDFVLEFTEKHPEVLQKYKNRRVY